LSGENKAMFRASVKGSGGGGKSKLDGSGTRTQESDCGVWRRTRKEQKKS